MWTALCVNCPATYSPPDWPASPSATGSAKCFGKGLSFGSFWINEWTKLSFATQPKFSYGTCCCLQFGWCPDYQVQKFLEEGWLIDIEGLQLLQQPSRKDTLPEILCVDEKFYEVLTHIWSRRKYVPKSTADPVYRKSICNYLSIYHENFVYHLGHTILVFKKKILSVFITLKIYHLLYGSLFLPFVVINFLLN